MLKDNALRLEGVTLPEQLTTPEISDVLDWQSTVASLVGIEQYKRWQREPWKIAPNAKPLEAGDKKLMRILGRGAWQTSKVTPHIKDMTPLIAIGGWCTWSEGDTQLIYKGELPDGPSITKPSDIIDYLYNNGNRWEQVVRCIGPMGISENQAIPYYIVVEDSLWAERIAEKLKKPEWTDDLQKGFKKHAQETSEGLIRRWLSVVSANERKDVYFFYTSDMKSILENAVNDFAQFLQYEKSQEIVQNMPILTMYTGFWLEAIKKIGTFRNSDRICTVSKNAEAVISEVETHFRLRGDEEKYVGNFFWNNQPADKTKRDNPNKDIYVAGFFQQRVPDSNKRLRYAYSLPNRDVLSFANRSFYVQKLRDMVQNNDKVYPFCNPVCLEAIATLYWNSESRTLLKTLTMLPKEGLITNPNSGKAVDSSYTNGAKNILMKLILYLDDVYQTVGYK